MRLHMSEIVTLVNSVHWDSAYVKTYIFIVGAPAQMT